MGDIADMMLDGTLCEGCGEFLGDGDGFPAYCGNCAPAGAGHFSDDNANKVGKKIECPTCKRRVKKIGLAQHLRDVHGYESNKQPPEIDPAAALEAIGKLEGFRVDGSTVTVGITVSLALDRHAVSIDPIRLSRMALKELRACVERYYHARLRAIDELNRQLLKDAQR